ncbi:ribonuclease H-like domain-containing protein [Butyrivibrio sp. VCB2006]|uniref:ribonuclease H-like domain-containing protein n=1 Tax=Butyrivibrio sp. VCB2006 TaxID=1280679 RepID=UPI0003F8AFBD|nr:ribonuclease H-like domain-containing protein [Butyrivibrio sp. VCB2006]
MIKTTEEFILPEDSIANSLNQGLGCQKEEILFMDIETTGLSAKTSDLYLIGVSYFQGNTWHIVQFMAESLEHEKEILLNFQNLIKSFKYVITFNGNRFDIPFLQDKLSKYELPDSFSKIQSFDLYKQILPYKLQLGLPDCKQKTIELYLGIDREDKYDGGKLIPVYKEFVETKDPDKLRLLLLHNLEDVKGMFGLLPMLRYQEFFNLFANMPKVSIRTDEEIDDDRMDYILPVRAKKVQANYYKDYDGSSKQEVFMKLSLPFELPSSLSGNLDNCYFKIVGKEATLRVPLYETELKYYYSNYKDYYYLPKEDMAIHKSIAEFVDKAYREKATAENCYTKKEGQYLLEWDLVFSPFFKENYKDKRFFFDLNENMKKSRFAMSLYASHVIAHILEL